MTEELKKLFRGKLVFSLILLSVLVNVGLLMMQMGKIDGLRVIDDFSIENGSIVSEEKWSVYQKSGMKKWCRILREKNLKAI